MGYIEFLHKQYQTKTNNNSYRQIENCIIWPTKLHPIECMCDDGMETRCIDNWHQYFQRQKAKDNETNNNNNSPSSPHSTIPIRYIRYRMIPTVLYNNPIPTSPIPQLAYYKQFNESYLKHNGINSNEYESNIATVDEHFSVRSALTSVLTHSVNTQVQTCSNIIKCLNLIFLFLLIMK